MKFQVKEESDNHFEIVWDISCWQYHYKRTLSALKTSKSFSSGLTRRLDGNLLLQLEAEVFSSGRKLFKHPSHWEAEPGGAEVKVILSYIVRLTANLGYCEILSQTNHTVAETLLVMVTVEPHEASGNLCTPLSRVCKMEHLDADCGRDQQRSLQLVSQECVYGYKCDYLVHVLRHVSTY